MWSSCILCYTDFAPGRRSSSVNAPEQKKCFIDFLKCLQVPKEELTHFQNIDFGTQLPFCRNCFRLSKDLNEQCSSKGELENEVLALQRLLCKKLKKLSTSMDKLDNSFRKVQKQVFRSGKVEPKVTRGRGNRERMTEWLGEVGDVADVSKSRNVDGKVTRLRRLILECKILGSPDSPQIIQDRETSGSETVDATMLQMETRRLIETYPINFIIPESKDLVGQGPVGFGVQDSLKESLPLSRCEKEEVTDTELEFKRIGVRDDHSLSSPEDVEADKTTSDTRGGIIKKKLVSDGLSGSTLPTIKVRKLTGNHLLDQKLKSLEDSSKSDESGLMKENFASDGLSSSTLPPTTATIFSRKRKAVDMMSLKADSTASHDELLQKELESTDNSKAEESDVIKGNLGRESLSSGTLPRTTATTVSRKRKAIDMLSLKAHSTGSQDEPFDEELKSVEDSSESDASGVTKENLDRDGLSSSALPTTTATTVSRKGKAIDVISLKADSNVCPDEPLDAEPEFKVTNDTSESDDSICLYSYENENCYARRIKIKDTDRLADSIVLSLEEEQAALSYKHSKILGKYDLVDENIMFKGIVIKNKGDEYECGDCGISKPCNTMDVYSIRQTGQFLRNHIQTKHLGGFICQWCTEDPEPSTFSDFFPFLQHIRSEHDVPEYECNVCGKPFMQRKSFFTHQQWSHKNEGEKADAMTKWKDREDKNSANKQCNDCNKIFATGNDLKRHSVTHMDGTERSKLRIPCKYCGQLYYSFTMLQHVKFVHEKSETQCKVTTTESNVRIPSTKQCHVCLKNFARDKDLKRHLEIHSKVKENKQIQGSESEQKQIHNNENEQNKLLIPCQYCGKMYFPSSILEHLKLVHKKSQTQWFSCKFCAMKFYSQTVLERHIRRNHSMTEELKANSYSCKFCHKVFLTMDKLKSHHQESHRKEEFAVEPIEIDLALSDSSSSSVKEDSDTHKVRVKKLTKKSPSPSRRRSHTYQCSLCPSKFVALHGLTKHLEDVHSDEIDGDTVYLNCKLCDSRFKRRDELSTHMKLVHTVVATIVGFKKSEEGPPVATPSPTK